MQAAAFPRAPIRILAIEDDPVLSAHIDSHLGQRGFAVTVRHDASDVVELVRDGAYDLVLLDILLPDSNGLEMLAELRRRQRVPVILMSALGAEQDRIVGFSQGADDYLPKPFSMGEMDVRIDAILRRVAYERADHSGHEALGQALDLTFDPLRSDVCNNGVWADLTSTEYRILETLLHSPNEVLSKTFLYQQALHRAYSIHDRSLDMHVSHIRRKLQSIGYSAGRVETVRGAGYVLKRVTP
ncbi:MULTISPECIES: response regulator transcription factor [unclassified Pseudomonas]|uniref:response regulator transcription factor n=1 Tax=unclassified Pseudomonas TaxID=196821 RepID=UPI0021C86B61|nr:MULTISPECIES: response regulator transcription factor [unclassified Pseudomonas]MCU1731574.1 response regulator transcription factor [Pseudomonas sp. 20P_3.2_Bac4]MCU1745805.1 response regulator transcription factor [Pseudomonas sp. 20P_3.2_Bac5]